MISVSPLRSYSVEHQLTFWGRGHEALAWSIDNQVALITKKSVYIYECSQTPALQKRPPALTIYPSRLDVPQNVYKPDTGNIAAIDAMVEENKQNVFELMRDHILRPHGYDTTVFHNYVIKALWSPLPIFQGLDVESRCILGVLTATHQLLIYKRRTRRGISELWTEPWEVILDVTALYNQYISAIWATEEENPQEKTSFDVYKRRLYQLAIINFLWLPDWSLGPESEYRHTDQVKGVFKSYFMTFHANGDVCIWKIYISKTLVPKFSAKILYRKVNLICDDIVSAAAYFYVSPDFGLLLLGTNKGRLISYKVDKLKGSVKMEVDGENQPTTSTSAGVGVQKYAINNEQCLWEEDLIRVEHLSLHPISSGRRKLDLIMVKNPNVLIATSLTISSYKVCGKEFSILKVPNGSIVGLSVLNEGEYIIVHEPGKIALTTFKDGDLEYIESSTVSIFDPQISSKKKAILLGQAVQKLEKREKKVKALKDSDKRLIFQGLALSPNKSMLCTARTVGLYHDHLQIRKPTQIVFYSLLPPENLFVEVKNLYAENKFSFRAISDVLVPFRYALRGKNSADLYKEILDWAVPLNQKSTEELRLLLWCLRIAPKSDPAEFEIAQAEKMFNPQSMKKLVAFDALHQYRIELVIDRIIQRRCKSVVRAVVENQEMDILSLDVELNKQSLDAMYQYLESKNDSNLQLPPKPIFNPTPMIPLCYWCKGPLDFPKNDINYEELFEEHLEDSSKTDLDREKITGWKWKARRHPVKEYGIHKPEICILSLLPLTFPYRRCTNCFVSCLMEPAFGQLPYCPLCNSMMYPNQPALTMEDSPQPIDLEEIQRYREYKSGSDIGLLVKSEIRHHQHQHDTAYEQTLQNELETWLAQHQHFIQEEVQENEVTEDIQEITESSGEDE